MIEYIKGELTELTPALATIEAAGIGYGLNISLNTFSAIQGKKEVKLYVYEAIREDAHLLYGFVNKKEREMFLLLITVSGVGANTARMMLSGMSVAELCNAISTGNAKLIQGIKGIGKMTAQRIIVDLRDKIVTLGISDEIPAGGQMQTPVNNQVKDEAIAALCMALYQHLNAHDEESGVLTFDHSHEAHSSWGSKGNLLLPKPEHHENH